MILCCLSQVGRPIPLPEAVSLQEEAAYSVKCSGHRNAENKAPEANESHPNHDGYQGEQGRHTYHLTQDPGHDDTEQHLLIGSHSDEKGERCTRALDEGHQSR